MASIPGDEKGWDGTVDVTIAAPFEKVWEIGSDWLKFPRGFLVDCTEGQNGVPGCVRKLRIKESEKWVAERLTHIDHIKHVFSYDVVGGIIGFEPGYQSSFQVCQYFLHYFLSVNLLRFTLSVQIQQMRRVATPVRLRLRAKVLEG